MIRRVLVLIGLLAVAAAVAYLALGLVDPTALDYEADTTGPATANRSDESLATTGDSTGDATRDTDGNNGNGSEGGSQGGSEGADLGQDLHLADLAPPPSARPAVATRIADGDSFEITWTDTDEPDEVRLLGINAPERGACFGTEAKRVLEGYIEGKDLLIEVVETEDDGFGRRIANVWVGETLVNLAVVADGGALALTDGGEFGELISDAQWIAQNFSEGLWGPDGCQAQESSVEIADLRYDARGRDDENPNDEWIEIENSDSVEVDLSGWGIRDESTRHRFFFPDGFRLDPGESVRVHSGCGSDDTHDLFWCASDPVWNNGGDTGYLVDADGRFVDSFPYSG